MTTLEHAVMERMLELDQQNLLEARNKELELALYLAAKSMEAGAKLLGEQTSARAFFLDASLRALGALHSEEYQKRGQEHTPTIIIAQGDAGSALEEV